MACFGATSLGMIPVLWVWSTKNVAMGILGYDCSGYGLKFKICCAFLLLVGLELLKLCFLFCLNHLWSQA
ncbi:hypothetical protein HanRHA438_Chr05g0214451 [Helianthus annuus]|uniref:Uncharacterized protein n=1 Tax=Helianthus annuus TaxID=4232 RepID=A0A9K3NLS9_HELAN|nr:hypothetical protein HanXRQr2_Chr05g0204741 [Helianthus annuus]KAJ0918159.1 hypothetical protein HanRHA438_Chr05g0214451 [Helianthus annuus]